MVILKLVTGSLVRLGGAVVAAVLVAGLALAPAEAAGAPPAAGTPGAVAQGLENLYAREQNWLTVQTRSLTDANTAATNMQNWINTFQGQGKDTTDLEAALAAFNAQVAAAEAAHATATSILASHAGFDDNGQVTDRPQAAATLRQAYQSLQAAHLTLVSAVVNLRLAVRTWINAQS